MVNRKITKSQIEALAELKKTWRGCHYKPVDKWQWALYHTPRYSPSL